MSACHIQGLAPHSLSRSCACKRYHVFPPRCVRHACLLVCVGERCPYFTCHSRRVRIMQMFKESGGSVEVKPCPLLVPLTTLYRDTTLVWEITLTSWTNTVSGPGFKHESRFSPHSVTPLRYSLSCACLWSWTFVLLKFSIETNKSVWTLALHTEWVWSVTEHWFITEIVVWSTARR